SQMTSPPTLLSSPVERRRSRSVRSVGGRKLGGIGGGRIGAASRPETAEWTRPELPLIERSDRTYGHKRPTSDSNGMLQCKCPLLAQSWSAPLIVDSFRRRF